MPAGKPGARVQTLMCLILLHIAACALQDFRPYSGRYSKEEWRTGIMAGGLGPALLACVVPHLLQVHKCKSWML